MCHRGPSPVWPPIVTRVEPQNAGPRRLLSLSFCRSNDVSILIDKVELPRAITDVLETSLQGVVWNVEMTRSNNAFGGIVRRGQIGTAEIVQNFRCDFV